VTGAAAVVAGGLDRVCTTDVCMLMLPTLDQTAIAMASDGTVPLHPVVVLPIINPSSSQCRLFTQRERGGYTLRVSNNAAVCDILARSPCPARPEFIGFHCGSLLFTSR
jgi:hypothetical protein